MMAREKRLDCPILIWVVWIAVLALPWEVKTRYVGSAWLSHCLTNGVERDPVE